MLKRYIYISNCHIYVLITAYLAKLQYIQLPKYICRKFQYIYLNAVFRIRFIFEVSIDPYIYIYLVYTTQVNSAFGAR